MSQKKRELEQNELADALTANLEKLQPYYSRIMLVVVAVVLGIVAVVFWNSTRRSVNEGQWEEYLDSTRFADIRGMEEVAKIYPDKPAGQLAMLHAADYDFARGSTSLVNDRDEFKDKIRKAIERYEVLVSDKYRVEPLLKRRATFALGHSHESLGEFDKARQYYQQLVDNAPDDPVGKLAAEGLERLADPSVVAIFDKFKQWQPEMTAPDGGPLLDRRPDISFPGLDAADFPTPAATETPAPSEAPAATEPPAPSDDGVTDDSPEPEPAGESPVDSGGDNNRDGGENGGDGSGEDPGIPRFGSS